MIGDDRILRVSSRGEAQLYDFPEPEDFRFRGSTEPQFQSVREPISSHLIPSGTSRVRTSPVYFDGTTYRLVVNTGIGFWGMVFTTTKGDSPLIVQLSNVLSYPGSCTPRICKAYAHSIATTELELGLDIAGVIKVFLQRSALAVSQEISRSTTKFRNSMKRVGDLWPLPKVTSS